MADASRPTPRRAGPVVHALWSTVALAAVPSAVDIALVVILRQTVALPLLVADTVAIAVASALSYAIHRRWAMRSSPYARWVQAPLAFVLVATLAGVLDIVTLRLLFAVQGFTTVGGLVVAKLIAMTVAAAARFVGYRNILSELVRTERSVRRTAPLDGACRFSIVIPAFREPDRIGDTVRTIRSELEDVDADGGLEIVVVDDGSGDGTGEAARLAGADQVVILPHNCGKGAAVRAGMVATTGRTVAFTDADLAYDTPHLRTLLHEVEAGWDVVIGNRRHARSQVARASGLRTAGSRMVNRISAAVLLAAPLDTQCGLKGFRGDVARDLFPRTRIDGFAIDIEILHLVERRDLSLLDIPVILDETGSRSTVRVGRDLARLTKDLIRIRRWASRGHYDADEFVVQSAQST